MTIKQTVRLVVPGAVLSILKRQGKNGISVFARIKQPGQRAQLGARQVFSGDKAAEQAAKRFEFLIADSEAKGWSRKASGGGSTASAFLEVPRPDALPASQPLAPKTPKADKVAKPNGAAGRPQVAARR